MSDLMGYERFVYPIEVGGKIAFTAVGSDEVEVDEQRWLTIKGNNSTVLALQPCLWDEIVSLLSAVDGDDYSIEWVRPAGYSTEEGIRIINADRAWSLDFSNAEFTFPPEVLGFPSDIDTDVASTFIGGVGHVIDSTQSHLGSWLPFTVADAEAMDKRSWTQGEVYASTDEDYPETAYVAMRDLRIYRRYSVEFVPGLRVKGGAARGRDDDYRETARVGAYTGSLDDDGDELAFDTFWRAVYGGREFVVVYVDGRTEIDPPEGLVELCRLSGDSARNDVSAIYGDPVRAGGEFYSLDMTLFVAGGRYDY